MMAGGGILSEVGGEVGIPGDQPRVETEIPEGWLERNLARPSYRVRQGVLIGLCLQVGGIDAGWSPGGLRIDPYRALAFGPEKGADPFDQERTTVGLEQREDLPGRRVFTGAEEASGLAAIGGHDPLSEKQPLEGGAQPSRGLAG